MKGQSEHFSSPALGGVTLHTIRWGDRARPTVVLLHGGGANAHWWDHLAPELAADHRVVALDFRGHGDSDHPEELVTGAFHQDLEALLAHLRAPDALLIGHSMGGRIALDHAARGDSTAGVVAIETMRGAARRDRRVARLALAARRSYRTHDEAVNRYRFLPPAPGASESLRRSLAEHSVRREPDGRYSFKFDARWFGLPGVAQPPPERIACPVLVIRGVESSLLTADGAASLVSEISGARLVEIDAAGHNVHLERPAEVLRHLLEFLRLVC